MEKLSLKSQSSLEYLLIVALTFALIVPTTYLFYNYSKESSQELTDAQIIQFGRTLVDTAESIFYSGQGSKTVLNMNVPEKIVGAVVIDGKELVLNMSTPFGISEIVFFSSVNLTTLGQYCDNNVCDIPEFTIPGLKKVKVEAINTESVTIQVYKMRKAQSAVEFIFLASFMLLVIVGFFAVTSSKTLEAQEEGNKKIAEAIANMAYREIEVAQSVNDGYTRAFLMPATVNGVNYSIKIIDNTELVVTYFDYEYVKFLPSNISGNVSRGMNRINKIGGIVYLQNVTI